MASSDDVGKKISQLHQELVNAYKKKIRFLLGRGGGVCAELGVTQEGSREQTWQSVMVGVGGSKKAILAGCNYWIAPHTKKGLMRWNPVEKLRSC